MPVTTAPQSSELRLARSLLAAWSERSGVEAVPAIEALAMVDDVVPPYPPVEELAAGTPVGRMDLRDALVAAVAAAADPGEVARIVGAAESLSTPVVR